MKALYVTFVVAMLMTGEAFAQARQVPDNSITPGKARTDMTVEQIDEMGKWPAAGSEDTRLN